MESLLQPVREAEQLRKVQFRDNDSVALSYVRKHIEVDYEPISFLSTSTRFKVESIPVDEVSNLVNLKRINDTRFINKFFETVNSRLQTGGLYIGCFESKEQRKERIFRKYPQLIAYPLYTLDFIWKRVVPKLKLTKKLYFALTKGQNRVLSVPEVLGRLVSCGFKIVDYNEVDNLTYFTVRKVADPAFDSRPTYGPLVTLKRVGLKGKMIRVYKLRTMHPFAEYLQEFIYQKNDLQEGGKFRDDFRITSWGKIFRKLWVDELPMIYNWMRGDLKLVGVRPISAHYFELYPEEFQERRLKYRPGLIPPFYADLPTSFDEIVKSEERYLDSYDKSPFLTDIKYLFKSLYNIFVKKARSK